ncbi:YsnF/AvaK domain-containing protein [Myxosarcina sp. GI1(2024)]
MANLENQNQANLKHLINQLDKQLTSYRVSDSQGRVRGQVADIYRDAQNNLQLLIELGERTSNSNWYRLTYNEISEINLETQTIITKLSPTELSQLPLYKPLPSDLKMAVADTTSETLANHSISSSSDVERPVTTETETIPLLEEKLTVKRYRRKVGEIVVRKEIETRMVRVPLRSEKLVVERVGANPEVLTEVDLGTEQAIINDVPELAIAVKSKLVSIPNAMKILQALDRETEPDTKVRLEIITDDKMQQDAYQAICDRFS